MSTTHERIVQAEEGIAQLQSALEHAQGALHVAEQVEVAAHKSRRLLKLLLLLGVLGLVVLIIVKITRRADRSPDLVLVEDPDQEEPTTP